MGEQRPLFTSQNIQPVSNPEHDVSQTPVHFPAMFAITKPSNLS